VRYCRPYRRNACQLCPRGIAVRKLGAVVGRAAIPAVSDAETRERHGRTDARSQLIAAFVAASSMRRKAARGPPFFLPLLDLFNYRAFARLNHICSVVALDIPILAQRRRFPIDLIGEGSDLHGIRQTVPDPDARRGGTAGGALFYPGKTSMLANDLAIPVGEGCPVRCRGGRGRSARARQHVDNFIARRIDDYDIVADNEEIIAAVLWHDLDNVGRKRLETHVPRNHRAD